MSSSLEELDETLKKLVAAGKKLIKEDLFRASEQA